MSHSSKIKDADAFFEVDAITRQIINKTPQKITLIQYDHNSESFTFSLPRHIEGHDMAESAKAEVHFINIETGGANSHADKYEMKDLQPDPNDESKVICTWLISNNATQYAGRLAFMIRFACLDDNNNYVYVWNTATNEEINIANGMDNGAAIVENYPDILAQWRQDVLGETAYLTDYFKQLPEGASLDDVKEPGNYIGYDNSGNYNGVQYNAPYMLFVGMHNYWNEELQLEYPIECQTRIYCHPLDENAEHIIQRRMCDNNGWTDWESVYATPQYVAERISQIPTSGGGKTWETIVDITTIEEVTEIAITQDINGNLFELEEAFLEVAVVGTPSNASDSALQLRTNVNSNAKGGTSTVATRVFRNEGSNPCAYRFSALGKGIIGQTYNVGNTATAIAGYYNYMDNYDSLKAIYLSGGTFGVGSKIVLRGIRR